MAGDAFGECFYGQSSLVSMRISRRDLPNPQWMATDDSIMACGLMEVLARKGHVDQDVLASVFAYNYQRDPLRGYGKGVHQQLQILANGGDWRFVSRAQFAGSGSMGNGAAMRVAPLGVYFADDLTEVMSEAKAQAEVTHAHPEGIWGAVAVALAAALAWQMRHECDDDQRGKRLLRETVSLMDASETREKLMQAMAFDFSIEPEEAAQVLGSGQRMLAQDTVPFAIWCAARHLGDFQATLWSTVTGLGDRDTTCAIAGGIAAAVDPVPDHWWSCLEQSPFIDYLRDGFDCD